MPTLGSLSYHDGLTILLCCIPTQPLIDHSLRLSAQFLWSNGFIDRSDRSTLHYFGVNTETTWNYYSIPMFWW